jgi:hypothetical protein
MSLITEMPNGTPTTNALDDIPAGRPMVGDTRPSVTAWLSARVDDSRLVPSTTKESCVSPLQDVIAQEIWQSYVVEVGLPDIFCRSEQRQASRDLTQWGIDNQPDD